MAWVTLWVTTGTIGWGDTLVTLGGMVVVAFGVMVEQSLRGLIGGGPP